MGKYHNFNDPVGLLVRMLRSGNRAAYGALFRAALSIGVTPLDWALQSKERRCLAASPKNAPPSKPLLLIVGPPRSGSTLLYQTIAHYADVSYPTNLTSMFSRSPLSATRWLQGTAWKTKKNFRSYYGQTAGLRSPNDGFELWNRWLGNDRYETPTSLDSFTKDDMHRFFSAWSQTFDKPFLNKNNRNVYCLALLAESLPQARFIIIRRNPLLVAQSLIEARVRIQGAKDRPWGLASSRKHATAGEPQGYVDDVCDQLIEIETRLQQQLASVAPARYVEVTYESFCQDPQAILGQIADSFEGVRFDHQRMAAELTPFSIASTLRLSQEEREQIERRLAGMKILRSFTVEG